MTSRDPEREPASEEDEIEAIVGGFLVEQARAAADQVRPLRRGTHAKGVCVRAVFEVPDLSAGRDRALAGRLAVGVFARPGSYPAVVRCANSNPTVNSDWQPDVRGLSFSIQLPAVSPWIHGHTRHDWSLQSAPTLPFNDVHAFAVFARVLSARNETVGLASLSAEDRLVFAGTKAAVMKQQRQQRPVRPYQQLRYWSNVPFRHGSQDIVKYSASPAVTNPARALEIGNPQALREELARHVNEDETMSAFDFAVQFLDTRRMRFERTRRDAAFWIDNASIEWPEHESPFHTVARLTLLHGGALPDDACEPLFIDVNEFSRPEHAPVGGINRARRHAELASRRARGAGE